MSKLKKIKEKILNNKKYILGVITGILISGTTVYAATVISATNVSYSNTSSKLSSTNVQGAIDELYNNIFNSNIRYLNEAIVADNVLSGTFKTSSPSLSSTSTNKEKGLYVTNSTYGGENEYYFRGAVTNNYVKFLGDMYRIVRINEDNTIRIIKQEKILSDYYRNVATYTVKDSYFSKSDIYSNGIKLSEWYQKIRDYEDVYVVAELFCEATKYTIGTSSETNYKATVYPYQIKKPTLACSYDSNGYGELWDDYYGILSYDELVFAGYYPDDENENTSTYLSSMKSMWTMSPSSTYSLSGSTILISRAWQLYNNKLTVMATTPVFDNQNSIYPVINLSEDVRVKGSGTSSNPYVVIVDE